MGKMMDNEKLKLGKFTELSSESQRDLMDGSSLGQGDALDEFLFVDYYESRGAELSKEFEVSGELRSVLDRMAGEAAGEELVVEDYDMGMWWRFAVVGGCLMLLAGLAFLFWYYGFGEEISEGMSSVYGVVGESFGKFGSGFEEVSFEFGGMGAVFWFMVIGLVMLVAQMFLCRRFDRESEL